MWHLRFWDRDKVEDTPDDEWLGSFDEAYAKQLHYMRAGIRCDVIRG